MWSVVLLPTSRDVRCQGTEVGRRSSMGKAVSGRGLREKCKVLFFELTSFLFIVPFREDIDTRNTDSTKRSPLRVIQEYKYLVSCHESYESVYNKGKPL